MVYGEYRLPADGAGVVLRQPAVDAVDVELVGTGQTSQLVALGVLVDADAAGSAQLALQAGLAVRASGQIVDLLFGQPQRHLYCSSTKERSDILDRKSTRLNSSH